MLKGEQRGNRNDDKEKFEKWRNWKGQSWEMSRKRMKLWKGNKARLQNEAEWSLDRWRSWSYTELALQNVSILSLTLTHSEITHE